MSLRHALLGLVAARPRSGYDLAKAMEVSGPGIVWNTTHASIYPELQRMTEEGLLERSERGQRRRATYSVTRAGLEELRSWLATPPAPRISRDERMLRVFNLWLLTSREARAVLRALANEHRERLEEYEQRRSGAGDVPADGGPSHYSRIALEAGIRYETAMAEWAEWAIEQVPARQGGQRSRPAAGR